MTPMEIMVELCERMTMMNGTSQLDVTWVVAGEKGTATLQVNAYDHDGHLEDIYTLSMELEREG